MAHAHNDHHDSDTTDIFGFWIYILSDCILFSAIFATYAVLYQNVYGGKSISELTNLPYVFIETMLLLTSSLTYGLAMLASYKKKIKWTSFLLVITFILGASFIGMEINEFISMYREGYSWQTNAALSSFFTLVGTHGLHVAFGLLTMTILLIQLLVFGFTSFMYRRLTYLGLFWAFLDVIWIFVFTIVYLMGKI